VTLVDWLSQAEAAWRLLERTGGPSAVELRLERDRGGACRARVRTEGVPIPALNVESAGGAA
jgi:hypothetical protein